MWLWPFLTLIVFCNWVEISFFFVINEDNLRETEEEEEKKVVYKWTISTNRNFKFVLIYS